MSPNGGPLTVGIVRVEPAGVEFTVADGQTVMAAATRAGYRWPTICGGVGTCRTCVMRVEHGADRIKPADAWERENLAALPEASAAPEGAVRLACQARPTGDVVVRKNGLRPLRRR